MLHIVFAVAYLSCGFCTWTPLLPQAWWRDAADAGDTHAAIGVEGWVAEIIFDKYLRQKGFPRTDLWMLLVWLRHYPGQAVIQREF